MLLDILNKAKIALVGLCVLFVILFAAGVVSLDALITFSLILLVLIIAATVFTAIFNVSENPYSGTRFLIGLGFLIIVFFISYGIASDTLDAEGNVISGSKLAEAGIYMLYTLVFLAVAAIFGSEIKRAIK